MLLMDRLARYAKRLGNLRPVPPRPHGLLNRGVLEDHLYSIGAKYLTPSWVATCSRVTPTGFPVTAADAGGGAKATAPSAAASPTRVAILASLTFRRTYVTIREIW